MNMDSSTKTNNAGAEVVSTTASSASSKIATENSNEPTSQSHLSTAQKVFAGRPNAGLMCSNLRANPFSVTPNSSQSSGILAKPKFSLKPSSLSATGDTNALPNTNVDQPPVPTISPFLRPAKLSYFNDDADQEARDAKETLNEASDVLKSKCEKLKSSDQMNEAASVSESANITADDSKSGADKSTNSENTKSTNSNSPPPSLGASTQGFIFGTSVASRASQSSFVFGEALDSRVTNVTKENGTNGHSDVEEKPKVMTLEEAATEYKKQQETGPLLPVVETVTGEEGESNVLQMNCKLFLFNDKDQSWAEKGRGLLRLNDCEGDVQSRIVMRTSGIHRVIMNTSIWQSMLCERANQKSIRITGTEAGQVQVYLITGSPADIDHLYNAVTYRVQRIKHQAATATQATSATSGDVTEANDSAKRKSESTNESEISPKKQKTEEEVSTSAE